jgi:plastocyanin
MNMKNNASWFFVPLLTILLSGGDIALAGAIKGKVQCKGVRDNRDAVVYLENVPGQFAPAKQPVEMDQLKMVFIPHVVPVVVGTTVKFLNSDPVLHNVFTPSKAGDKFNLGTWPKGEAKSYTFGKLGEVRLLCNVHPEMEAWVVVLPNSHFAKTGPDGSYSIANVPAGKYSLKVWHEKLKFPPQEIEVPAAGDVVANAGAAK